jgi:peptide/nickel transport system substrate-binding protein
MTMFNTSAPPFDDPRARRAWALIMDPANRNETVLHAPGQTLRTFFAETSEFVDKTAVTPSNNRAEAQALLDQLAAEGRPLKFTYTTNASPSARTGAEYWLGQLAGMRNIEMKPEFLDGGSYVQKVQVLKNFEAAEFTIAFDDPEPVLYNFLHSRGTDNRTHWSNPVVDAALDQARTTADPAVRRTAYATVQQELVKDMPLFAYEQAFTAAIQARTRITDLVVFEDGIVQYDRLGLG